MATKTAPKTQAKTARTAPKADPKAEAKVNVFADKQGRLPYHGLEVDDEGAPTKLLKEIPEDFDSKKHQALKAKNFENEADWFEFRALDAESKAAAYRKKAEEARATGGKNGAKMKKFLAMKNRYEAMMNELQGDGVDLEELFNKIKPDSDDESNSDD